MFNFNELVDDLLKNNDIVEDDICLISNLPLKDNSVTLECGHKFNYNCIYSEVKKQKLSFNHLETQNLAFYQIKCPYCRNVQNKLLPYKNFVPKTKNVNWPLKYCMNLQSCKYIFKSGKKKNKMCEKMSCSNYCSYHNSIMIKKQKKQKQKKQQQQKQEQKKNKQKKENVKISNIVASSNPTATAVLSSALQSATLQHYDPNCKHILLKGKNKGKHCCKKINFKIPTNISYCTNHYKYYNNYNNNQVETI